MELRKILFLFILLSLFSCQLNERFEKMKWQLREDPAFPPKSRRVMLNDLRTNYKLTGMSYSEVINLLGEPDFADDSSIIYEVIEDYGNDIDPVYTKSLELKLTNDKSVKAATVQEWRK